MTSTKTVIAAIAAAIGIASTGCGNRPSGTQTAQSQRPGTPTEWNDIANHISPFTRVRFDNDKVLVTYNGTEYELVALNGVSTGDVVKYCQAQYRDRWQKRFSEDIVPVLKDMGHPINAQHTVALSLIDSKSGQTVDAADAPMTEQNRAAIIDAELAEKQSR